MKITNTMKKGFTLLEMLVVIGIIGIIMGLSMVSYSTAQKKARDARRKSDLKSIQNSLEQYYAICGYSYPIPTNSAYISIIAPTTCGAPPVNIMPTVPTDPRTGIGYVATSSDGTTYSICLVPTGSGLETEVVTSPYCLYNQQ